MAKSGGRRVGRYVSWVSTGHAETIWSWERKQLLRELYPSGVAIEDIIGKLIPLPGEKNITPRTVKYAAWKMRLRRTPMKEQSELVKNSLP